MNITANQSIFPPEDKAPAEYFVGTAYVKLGAGDWLEPVTDRDHNSNKRDE